MSYDWDYLNSTEATPMYVGISQHVERIKSKTVLDIGCGYTRWLESYTGSAKVTGVDNNTDAIEYCRQTYSGEFILEDAWDLQVTGQYDTIVLGGLLYYMKGDTTPLDYVESLIERYNPRHIVIQEPFPSISHKSPDFIPLLDRYAWRAEWFDLDMRMGQRIVLTLDVDRVRPERLIKKQSTNLQSTLNTDILQYGVYTANTEKINDKIDGRVLPSEPARLNYASVCAGFKSLYKACIDYTPGKHMTFAWFDISPTAVLYKMYQDLMRNRHANISWDEQLNIYRKDYDSRIIELREQIESIDATVDKQLVELGITKDDWNNWLLEYAKSNKHYVKCDIVNNLRYARQHIPANSWLWYSNVFDWHQFTFPDKSKRAWIKYMSHNNVHLVGKTIPTKVEQHIADYISSSTSAEGYTGLLEHTANRVWLACGLTDIDQESLIIKSNDYGLTFRNNDIKIKVFTGYPAIMAADNYNRCKHLIPGTHSEHTVDGIRIETYSIIVGDTLDKVDPEVYKPCMLELIDRLCKGVPAPTYPFDISEYNMVYTKEGRIEIIDWDYCITGSIDDLTQRIEKLGVTS